MASVNEIVKGLQILAKYSTDGEEGHLGGADHDIIYGPPMSKDVSPEDATELEALGWHLDLDYGQWAHFV